MSTRISFNQFKDQARWAAMFKSARDDKEKDPSNTIHEFDDWMSKNFSAKLLYNDSVVGIEGIEFNDDSCYTMFLLKYSNKRLGQ